ncbi:MAG: MoxR family ATPase [Clostridia bacterium]|nr:MoxR family ATPase [Clostridia bacterium]
MEIRQVSELAGAVRENVAKVIVGKEGVIDLVVTALFAGGHVLLEDVPGTGKTKLAKALARSVDAQFRRVQFTPDLLPSDLTGIHFFNQQEGRFTFRAGPVFTNILLADEINRATPRTQSSLLECMEEKQVTIDGETRIPGAPFFVIATQNPIETQGTFPLPEAQMDRFLMQVSMGYPDREQGRDILRRFIREDPLSELAPVCTGDAVIEASAACRGVYVHEAVMDYLLAVAEQTRTHEAVALGVSPRGCLAMLRAVQVLAAIRGRDFATPDDVRTLTVPVYAHRILLAGASRRKSASVPALLEAILAQVPAPVEAWEKTER